MFLMTMLSIASLIVWRMRIAGAVEVSQRIFLQCQRCIRCIYIYICVCAVYVCTYIHIQFLESGNIPPCSLLPERQRPPPPLKIVNFDSGSNNACPFLPSICGLWTKRSVNTKARFPQPGPSAKETIRKYGFSHLIGFMRELPKYIGNTKSVWIHLMSIGMYGQNQKVYASIFVWALRYPPF